MARHMVVVLRRVSFNHALCAARSIASVGSRGTSTHSPTASPLGAAGCWARAAATSSSIACSLSICAGLALMSASLRSLSIKS